MADIPLTTINGSGGKIFVPTFTSGNIQTASGQSGTFITITPPAGKAARLVALTSDGTAETAISIAFDGTDAVTSKILAGSNGNDDDSFQISSGGNSTFSGGEIAASQPPIQGDIDQAITVTKAGSTAAATNHSYKTGIFI